MSHRSSIATLALVAGLVTACAPGTATSTPPAASAIATPSAGTSAAGSASEGPGASAPPSATSSAAATDCPVQPLEARIGPDRLLSVSVQPGSDADLVRFSFDRSAPATTNQPTIAVEPATPPFTMDPSGLPLEVAGSRFVRVKFSGQSLYDDAGTPYYTGPATIVPTGTGAVRAVVQEAAYEGVSSWIVGYDGPGCVQVAPGDSTTSVLRVEVRAVP